MFKILAKICYIWNQITGKLTKVPMNDDSDGMAQSGLVNVKRTAKNDLKQFYCIRNFISLSRHFTVAVVQFFMGHISKEYLWLLSC